MSRSYCMLVVASKMVGPKKLPCTRPVTFCSCSISPPPPRPHVRVLLHNHVPPIQVNCIVIIFPYIDAHTDLSLLPSQLPPLSPPLSSSSSSALLPRR
eukprot:764425-Hanusia_phi.AAC.6